MGVLAVGLDHGGARGVRMFMNMKEEKIDHEVLVYGGLRVALWLVQAPPPPLMELPDFTVLPEYFPVHLSVRVNTDFTHVSLLAQLDDRLLATKKITEDFLLHVSANSHLLQNEKSQRFLQSQLRVYAELVNAKYKLQHLQTTLKTAHRAYVDSRRLEQPLNLETYADYVQMAKPNFADAIVEQLDSQACDFTPILAADASYQYLKNACFVLEHPEDPLPDDPKDEEELTVAGGKISLKDPLSLNYFVHPVMLRKCGHIYEREHIMQSLHGSINCPITGCSAQLGSGDLQDDKLMALRVKVYLAQEKKRERAVRV